MTKFLNALIIFVFLFSIIFFCVDTQIKYNNQNNSSITEDSAGTGDISTDIRK